MPDRELFQNAASPRCEGDNNNTAIGWIAFAANQPAQDSPVDQAHDRVVPLLQKLCELRYGRLAAAGESCNTEHKLMLLRRDL